MKILTSAFTHRTRRSVGSRRLQSLFFQAPEHGVLSTTLSQPSQRPIVSTTQEDRKDVADTTPLQVPADNMHSLEDAPDNARFELMFATKNGLPVPYFPVSHSAIALRNLRDETFAIYGRQSPLDFSNWWRDGFNIKTQVDNERKYMSPKYGFTAYPTGVSFPKKAVMEILTKADQLINQQQSCNMVRSNCYSFSTVVMTMAVEALGSKSEMDSRAICHILSVMNDHALRDHLAIGVLNNAVVTDHMVSVFSVIEQRINAKHNKTEAEQQLFNTLSDTMEKIHNNPYAAMGLSL